MSTVGFFGSRALGADQAGSIEACVARFAAAGRTMATGCATGADAYALAAALRSAGPSRTVVFAAFDRSGVGSWRQSNVEGVQAAASAGATVHWLAGGPLTNRLVWRLVNRSRAMVDSLDAAGYDEHSGIVGWVTGAPPRSPGSWGTVKVAIARGLRCVVFPVGWPAASMPLPARGAWVQAGSGIWSRALLWVGSTA